MEKIKQFIESEKGRSFLIIIIVILFGLSSFGLGKMSNSNDQSISIKYSDLGANTLKGFQETTDFIKKNPNLDKSNQTISRSFYASSRGKKYYSADCSAGKNIKNENKIFFKTAEEAEDAGYSLSDACR